MKKTARELQTKIQLCSAESSRMAPKCPFRGSNMASFASSAWPCSGPGKIQQ